MFNTKNEIYFTVIFGSLFFILLIGIIVVTALLYYNRKKLHRLEVSQFQHILLQTQMEIQENTFKAISQEIHDNIGQMLSLAKMNLSKFELDPVHSDEAVLSAKDLVSKAVAALRDLSKTLNTDTISNLGLLQAIMMELQLVEKTTGVGTSLEVSGPPHPLPAQNELILFRIVQEALHNSIKHAEASSLQVKASFDHQVLQLLIADNGTGFDESETSVLGSGLKNMQSRSKLIGASWKLQTTKGEGTTISITIPTNHSHDNTGSGR